MRDWMKTWNTPEARAEQEAADEKARLTPTGRVPEEPNIQNINPKTEEAAQIKAAFLNQKKEEPPE